MSSDVAVEDPPIPSGFVHYWSLHIILASAEASATAGKIHYTVSFLSPLPLGPRHSKHPWLARALLSPWA